MGAFDSYAIVLMMVMLSLMGWMAEFYLYMGHEILPSISEHWYYQMVEDFTPFIDFLRSSYYVLIFVIIVMNILSNGLSTTDPIYFGAFAILTFIMIWFINQAVIPSIMSTFTGLDLPGVNNDWWYMLQSSWYFAALSGLVGAGIGYLKGSYAKKQGVMF